MIASCGVSTIGSFSLKEVFKIIGNPVFLPNNFINSKYNTYKYYKTYYINYYTTAKESEAMAVFFDIISIVNYEKFFTQTYNIPALSYKVLEKFIEEYCKPKKKDIYGES